MRNTQNDLVNTLFEQMERLNDEDLTGDALNREVERSRAMVSVASQINASRALVLKAREFIDRANDSRAELPEAFR